MKDRRLFIYEALVPLFTAAVFFVAFEKIGDPDAWLHLSLGKLIWGMNGMPALEPLTYTTPDAPFYYSSWLFGITCHLLYTVSGATGLVMMKASVVALAFYIMLRDSLRPYDNKVVGIIILLAAVELSKYRFVLRPDIFFMVFLSFSIFSLNAYLYDNRKYIYALPFVHMIWANMHSSITVMFVPFGAFIVGGYIQHYLGKRGVRFELAPSTRQIKVMTVIFIASFGATLISPYFIEQYFYGSMFLSSKWYTKNIIELMPMYDKRWVTLFGITAIVLASFFINRRRFSLIHLLLVAPFLLLTFDAARFIFIIAITAFPVAARNLSASMSAKGWKPTVPLGVITAACVIVYAVISVAPVIKDGNFGVGFNYALMPKGAVEYMDRNGIYGRVINSYHFGQYLNWKSYPERTVFVDARGHLPEKLLDEWLHFSTNEGNLNDLYEKYKFESVLIDYPDRDKPYAMSSSPQWALVYWDDTALLYLRRGGPYEDVIEIDEYRSVMPELTPLNIIDSPPDGDKKKALIGELTRTVEATGSSRANTLLGYIYYVDGNNELALRHLLQAVDTAPTNATAHYGLGLVYSRIGNISEARRQFRECLKLVRRGRLAEEAGMRLKELSG